jgi:hypothetical protein
MEHLLVLFQIAHICAEYFVSSTTFHLQKDEKAFISI